MNEYFLGIDVGSVGTKLVLLDPDSVLARRLYVRTNSDPLAAIKSGLSELLDGASIIGVGVTGSGKELAGMAVGADRVKNEISSHALAAIEQCPKARTILEIGGQDSKIILLREGLIEDFAMNSVCAAGTGSFLEQQAQRLQLSVQDLGALALQACQELTIAARCTVFAESDMVYKQQLGYPKSEIVYGLCLSLARNYLNTLGKGRSLAEPIVFQGGVAANFGMRRALTQLLGTDLVIPVDFFYMGAIGAALFALRDKDDYGDTAFSPSILEGEFTVDASICGDCEQMCSVVKYQRGSEVLGYRGDVCGKYSLPGGTGSAS